MSWGTYSITKINEGQYFWCAWKDWKYKKPPTQQGFAATLRKADEKARESSGGSKATRLQDSCAKAKHRIIVAAQLKKQEEQEAAKREKARIREEKKASEKLKAERRKRERERRWERLRIQREKDRAKRPRPGTKRPFHAPGEESQLDKERPFKLPGTPVYEWDRSSKKPFKLA